MTVIDYINGSIQYVYSEANVESFCKRIFYEEYLRFDNCSMTAIDDTNDVTQKGLDLVLAEAFDFLSTVPSTRVSISNPSLVSVGDSNILSESMEGVSVTTGGVGHVTKSDQISFGVTDRQEYRLKAQALRDKYIDVPSKIVMYP